MDATHNEKHATIAIYFGCRNKTNMRLNRIQANHKESMAVPPKQQPLRILFASAPIRKMDKGLIWRNVQPEAQENARHKNQDQPLRERRGCQERLLRKRRCASR
ncbi:hypothetical protein [Caballeronia arvi]|uniref:hypothetical protein n=1 Tax=Caballeronia arvi TaxID=1777135 RepID=UPI0011805E7D|nr:hypothetical protein [Caballeronia arvi]